MNLFIQERKTRIINLAFLAVIVLLVFARTLTNEFVWDDTLFLLNVDTYRTFDFGKVFLTLGNGLEYLPVRDLSYVLDFAFWGENSAGFHFTNLVLYFLNIVAVYLFTETVVTVIQLQENVRSRLVPAKVAFWTAVFFILLPIHCEAVNFIGGGRNTLLAALFALLSSRAFILFIGGEKGNSSTLKAVAAFFWYILAVLSKATVVSLPLFFLTLCMVIKCRPLITRLAVSSLFILMSVLVYVQFTTIAERVGLISYKPGESISLANRIATAVQIPFFYLGKFINPTSLSTDYGVPFPPTLESPHAIACLIAIMVLALAAFAVRNRAPLVFVAICWYVVMLIPVLHLLPTAVIVADRYAYLPSYAFCFLLAYWGTSLKIQRPYIVTLAGIAVCLAYGFLAFEQNKVWKSNLTLWQHTILVSPRSVQAMENLGTIYFRSKEYDKAFSMLHALQRIEPMNPIYDFFEGKYFYEHGNFQNATISFGRALEKKNDLIDALYYLADVCEKMQNRDGAISYYRRVISSGDLERGQYKKKAAMRLAALAASNN